MYLTQSSCSGLHFPFKTNSVGSRLRSAVNEHQGSATLPRGNLKEAMSLLPLTTPPNLLATSRSVLPNINQHGQWTPFVQFIEFHPQINILNQYFVLYWMANPSPILGTQINTSRIMVRSVNIQNVTSYTDNVSQPAILRSIFCCSDNKFGKNKRNKNTACRVITDPPRGQEDVSNCYVRRS